MTTSNDWLRQYGVCYKMSNEPTEYSYIAHHEKTGPVVRYLEFAGRENAYLDMLILMDRWNSQFATSGWTYYTLR